MFISDHDRWPHTQSTQFRALAEQICRFVEQRPKLTDITITDLPTDLEAQLRDALVRSRRPIRRLMIGEGLGASLQATVPSEAPIPMPRGWFLPGEWVRRQRAEFLCARKRQYLMEVWQSYEVMFDGLALEQSGYRPCLLTKCPRRWVDYLRVHSSG